jgi:hypothetical protein
LTLLARQFKNSGKTVPDARNTAIGIGLQISLKKDLVAVLQPTGFLQVL